MIAVGRWSAVHSRTWLMPLLDRAKHANFFEACATGYSKAAMKGNWNEVWDAFNSRKGAKTLREGGGANGVDDRQGGLFGVAAE